MAPSGFPCCARCHSQNTRQALQVGRKHEGQVSAPPDLFVPAIVIYLGLRQAPLTDQQPEDKAQPGQVAQLQHEANVEKDAKGGSQWHQRDLRVQG